MERAAIESYLKSFALEEILDEAINDVVERRPANPYGAIASFLESKTVPEILDVKIACCLVGRNMCGVDVTVVTNISSFSASASEMTYESNTDGEMIREYAVLQEKARDSLKGLDPRNIVAMDEAIALVPGMEKSVALALSMACCRAGARHKGMPLYRFLADLAGTSPGIPMPVVSVLTRSIAGSIAITQNITVTPTTPSFVEGAYEAVLKASLCVQRHLDSSKVPTTVSDSGCPCVTSSSLLDAVGIVKAAFAEEPPEGGLKLGVDVRAGDVSFVEDDMLQYRFDVSEGPATQGEDLVETIVSLWREGELISIEDPVASADTAALRLLKEKVASASAELKEGEMAYNVGGVGGEVGCILQIIADRGFAKPEQVASLAQEMIFNAVKIRLRKVGSISAAMAIAKACQQAQVAVVLGCDEGAPESADSFLGDLAVAMGVGQLAAGGFASCEYSCKYQRVLEIARGDDTIPFTGRKFRK